MQVLAQGETPLGQQAAGIEQLQVAHPGVVMVLQGKARTIAPGLPVRRPSLPAEHTCTGDDHQPFDKVQARVQVNLQGGQNVFLRKQMGLNFSAPMGGEFARRRSNEGSFSGHYRQNSCFFGSKGTPGCPANGFKENHRVNHISPKCTLQDRPQGYAPGLSSHQ